jgi:hypothetical protein
MQFAAVYDDPIYSDAFLIPLDKSGLDIGAYYDLMEVIKIKRTRLSIAGTAQRNKPRHQDSL